MENRLCDPEEARDGPGLERALWAIGGWLVVALIFWLATVAALLAGDLLNSLFSFGGFS